MELNRKNTKEHGFLKDPAVSFQPDAYTKRFIAKKVAKKV